MRLSSLLVCVLAVLMLNVSSAQAQRRKGGETKERGEGKEEENDDDDKGPDEAGPAMGLGAGMAGAVSPLMRALDNDGDGVISAKEIKAAVRSLKTLDANRDGKLTPDELAAGGAPGMMGAGGAGGAGGGARGGAGGAGGAGFGGPGAGGFGAGGGSGGASGGAGGFSQPPGSGFPPQTGKLMGYDRNKDGRLTREELPEQFRPLFDRLDMDHDGSVDLRELKAATMHGNPGARVQ